MNVRKHIKVPATVTGDRAVELVYSRDDHPGIHRERKGDDFLYRDGRGRRVRDSQVLERIAKLAIPPAYTDVWICADPNGHLQATGRDARGRKQYRYHKAWRAVRDRDKFSRLAEFGQRLPKLRRRVNRDLGSAGLCHEKVLALAIRVLETTLIRVGNREYSRSNHSYGLTTLRSRHADFPRSGLARLRFRGKSGKNHEINVDDGQLVRLLRRCQRLPGQTLFRYVDEDDVAHAIDSGQINHYVHDAMGEAFTAKDFRTWGATRLAAEVLATKPPGEGTGHCLAIQLNDAIAEVAAALGNTVAVCRNSYIHPAIIDAWHNGELRSMAERSRSQHWIEKRVIAILERDMRRRKNVNVRKKTTKGRS